MYICVKIECHLSDQFTFSNTCVGLLIRSILQDSEMLLSLSKSMISLLVHVCLKDNTVTVDHPSEILSFSNLAWATNLQKDVNCRFELRLWWQHIYYNCLRLGRG